MYTALFFYNTQLSQCLTTKQLIQILSLYPARKALSRHFTNNPLNGAIGEHHYVHLITTDFHHSRLRASYPLQPIWLCFDVVYILLTHEDINN